MKRILALLACLALSMSAFAADSIKTKAGTLASTGAIYEAALTLDGKPFYVDHEVIGFSFDSEQYPVKFDVAGHDVVLVSAATSAQCQSWLLVSFPAVGKPDVVKDVDSYCGDGMWPTITVKGSSIFVRKVDAKRKAKPTEYHMTPDGYLTKPFTI